MIAKNTVRLTMDGSGTGKILVNGADLSMVTERVEIRVDRDAARVILTLVPGADLEVLLEKAEVSAQDKEQPT